MSWRILQGDVLDRLRELPAESVQCCATSPPYWSLRDYGVAGQIGMEPTPDEHVAKLVEVFREVRRVLRNDGVLWLNYGDAYAGSPNGGQGATGQLADRGAAALGIRNGRGAGVPRGLKPKDLIGLPWRLARALQEPYYTGKIKDERDRVWLAAIIDGEGCFFIHKRKAGTPSYSKFTRADGTEANYIRTADTFGVGLEICNTSKAIIDRVQAIAGGGTVTTQSPQQNARRKQTIYRWRVAPNEAKRIAQEVYPHLVGKQHQARLLFNCPSTGDAGAAAHQAMMDLHNGVETAVDYPAPPSLFEPGWYLRQDVIWSKPNAMPESVTDRPTRSHEYVFLLSKSARYFWDANAVAETGVIAAGTKAAKGSVDRASTPGVNSRPPEYKVYNGVRNLRTVWTIATEPYAEAHFAVFPEALAERCIKAGSRRGDTVLDPFAGSGTTLAVAERLGRDSIGIELNPAYIAMAERRIRSVDPTQPIPLKNGSVQGSLFQA